MCVVWQQNSVPSLPYWCQILSIDIDWMTHDGGSSSSREPNCQIVAPILPMKQKIQLVRASAHLLSAQREGSYAPPPPACLVCQHSQRPLLLPLWRKPLSLYYTIRTLGAPGIRPDARRVSNARLLSQTSANHEVADRHISPLTQDCRSWCRTAHSYVRVWYRTDQHVRIHLYW